MNNYPLVIISVLFISGIVIQKYLQPGYSTVFLLLLFMTAAAWFLLIKLSGTAFYKTASIPVYISVVLVGQLDMCSIHTDPGHLPENIFYQNVAVCGAVEDIRLIKNENLNFIISTDSIITEKRRIVAKTKLLCRLYERNRRNLNAVYDKLSVGNGIKISGKLVPGKKAGNPGEFDYSDYLRSKGINGILNINSAGRIIFLNNNTRIPDYLFKIRKTIDNKIDHYSSPQSAALLRGLLLADRGLIDTDLRTYFINSGLVHLLAVSGLHVGYIILIVIVLTGRLNLYFRSIATVIVLVLFTLVTGMPSSVVRASVMASVLITAFLTGRSTSLTNSLAAAALLILVFNPEELFNPGFQLSFSAVLAIGVFYPKFSAVISAAKYLNEFIKKILLFLAVSLSAQIGTLPLTLFYFGKMSIVGLIANLIAIPAVGIIVGVGIITVISAFIIPTAAVYFGASNDLLIYLFNSFVSIAGSAGFSYLTVGNFTIPDIIIFYLLSFFLIKTIKKFTHTSARILLLLLTVLCLFLFRSMDDVKLLKDKKLNLAMIDVGQGDSFLIKFPDGKTALIDAGIVTQYFDNGTNVIIPLLKRLGVDKIDYGFISHIDADHYAGFVPLIHEGYVRSIFKPAVDSSNKRDLRFEKFAADNNVPVQYYRQEIIKTDNARIYILNDTTINSVLKKTTNNSSGLIKIVFGNSSVLFTGDLGKEAERFYSAEYGEFLKSNILKISHHGSKTGTSDELLNLCAPEICLISAGAGNRFGHPSKETLDKIRDYGSVIYRTDISGAAILYSGGKTFKLCDWR